MLHRSTGSSSRHASRTAALALVVVVVGAAVARADTAIETETAQIGAQGDITISNSFQMEEASDGDAAGTLTQFEYGITSRSEILIEPFFREWSFPDGDATTSGYGDLEITPSYEFLLEKGARPALLAAFKLKVPTGTTDEASGKFDYYPYLILGEHVGPWTFNANLGVDFITTEMDGIETQVIWDLEVERHFADLTMFAEVFTDESGVAAGSTAGEYHLSEHVNVFLALGYDAENTIIVRPGVNLEL